MKEHSKLNYYYYMYLKEKPKSAIFISQLSCFLNGGFFFILFINLLLFLLFRSKISHLFCLLNWKKELNVGDILCYF